MVYLAAPNCVLEYTAPAVCIAFLYWQLRMELVLAYARHEIHLLHVWEQLSCCLQKEEKVCTVHRLH